MKLSITTKGHIRCVQHNTHNLSGKVNPNSVFIRRENAFDKGKS